MTCADTCMYCDMPLSPRHEHDHMPIPARFGGEQTVCACVNCHDLKDRTLIGDWNPSVSFGALMGLWRKAVPVERILLARLFSQACN